MSLTAHEMRHLANTLEALAIDVETLHRRIRVNGDDPTAENLAGEMTELLRGMVADLRRRGAPDARQRKEIIMSDIEDGMTLRDYFAAKAMQPMLAEWKHRPLDEFAELAYSMADAMLKARRS